MKRQTLSFFNNSILVLFFLLATGLGSAAAAGVPGHEKASGDPMQNANPVSPGSISYGPGDEANSGTIRGTVQTSDGKPAEAVSVILEGTGRGVTTDEEGHFEFRKLRAGDHTLRISLAGYEPVEKTVTVQENKTEEVSIQLSISSKTLQEVTVISSNNPYSVRKASSSLRLDELLIQVPQNVQVVSTQALQDQGVISMSDGVLRNVSGTIRLEHWADLYTNVHMRGSQVTALRNGMSVATSYWSPLTEDMSVVDHIEFVKGPAGFLMPVGDPAGVYNVVTKKPTGETKGEISLTAGSFDLYRGTLDLDGKLDQKGKLLYRLNLAAKQANSFRPYEYNNRVTIAPVLSYQLDDNTVVSAEYLLSKVKMSDVGSYYVFSTKGYGELPRDFTNADPGIEPTYITDQSVTVNLQHRFNDQWRFTAQVAYLDYKQQGTSLWATSVSADSMIRNLGIWDASATGKFAQAYLNGNFRTGAVKHRVLIGLDANQKGYMADWNQVHDLDLPDDQFKFDAPSYGMPSNGYPEWDRSTPLAQRAGPYGVVDQTYYGAYLQDELGFFDNRFRLTLAGRYSYARLNDFGSPAETRKLTPRIGLSWSIDRQTSVYALYDDAFLPQSGARKDGKDVKPLTGNNLEAGIKRDFAGGRWTASLAAYHIYRNNVNSADPGDPTGRFIVQLGQTRAQGIEFDLKGEVLPGLTLTVNYAYTDAKITKSDTSEAGKATIGQKVPGYATHTLNAWASYQVRKGLLKGLGISAGYSYLGDRQTWEWGATSPFLEMPDYSKIDGGLFYETGHFRISLNMYNLANNFTYSGSGFADYYYWQADPPRNFRVGVVYRW